MRKLFKFVNVLSQCPLFPSYYSSFQDQLLMTNLLLPSDVDECKTTCMKDTQQCINSQGSYNCKCKAGYEKKNGSADDECVRIKGKSLSFVGLRITLPFSDAQTCTGIRDVYQ